MKIKSVTVGGFKNLKETHLQLSNITAIISPNNYGKSNLLEAIDFGTDFLLCNSRERKTMMRWIKGIPINKSIADSEFIFQVEFEDEALDAEYRFVRYGYKFAWFRDDGSGQRITDEWIDARASESVRYTSFLKRREGKYRKEKATNSFRKIILEESQLAIDILGAIEDIAIQPVIKAIRKIDYHVCSSLDLGDRFQAAPIEYINEKDTGSISFDDKDVPRALYKLMERDPQKYELFREAVFDLFPDFIDVSIQAYELKKGDASINMILADSEGNISSLNEEAEEMPDVSEIPFRIKDELYSVLVTNEHLNQPINMSMMSTGTKRVFWLLANVFIAGTNGMSIVGVEELETSIHPRLLKRLLEVLNEALENTSLIISSHSPFLVQYLKPEKIYVGHPNEDGTAEFKKIQGNKVKALIASSRNLGMSVGEFLFELMAGDADSASMLSFYLEG